MKKAFAIIFIASVVLSSCKKDDKSVFDQSPDERLTEKLAAYQTQLSGAQNGWKAFLRVDSGRGSVYSFYFKFSDANRVVMISDFDSLSAVTPKESSYRLKALQQPSLLFDTYSYLHVLADPDPGVSGGTVGAGLLSDFEFYFDSTGTDTMMLVGRQNASKLTLIRATQEEAAAYNNGGLASGLYINKILTYFKRLTVGSQLYDVKIDPVSRQFMFSWLDASGNYQTFATGYYFVAGGIIFTNPLVNGAQTISGFDNISWAPAAETINLTVNNAAATITGIVVPLKVDVNAPASWYQFALTDPTYYSVSYNGFHVNGVDDAYKIRSIPNFYFLLSLPHYGSSGGSTYDLVGYTFLANNSLSISFGSAFNAPTFTTDGRAIFSYLGTLGTVPAAYSSIIANTRTNMSNTSGFYFVQTGINRYDMVSAFDGKSWITWEPY